MNDKNVHVAICVFRISVLYTRRCHGDDDESTLCPEETRSPKGFQSRSGGRRAGPACHGTQQSRLKNRLHLATWSSRGSPTSKQRQGSFLSRPLTTSLQVQNFKVSFPHLETRLFLLLTVT